MEQEFWLQEFIISNLNRLKILIILILLVPTFAFAKSSSKKRPRAKQKVSKSKKKKAKSKNKAKNKSKRMASKSKTQVIHNRLTVGSSVTKVDGLDESVSGLVFSASRMFIDKVKVSGSYAKSDGANGFAVGAAYIYKLKKNMDINLGAKLNTASVTGKGSASTIGYLVGLDMRYSKKIQVGGVAGYGNGILALFVNGEYLITSRFGVGGEFGFASGSNSMLFNGIMYF